MDHADSAALGKRGLEKVVAVRAANGKEKFGDDKASLDGLDLAMDSSFPALLALWVRGLDKLLCPRGEVLVGTVICPVTMHHLSHAVIIARMSPIIGIFFVSIQLLVSIRSCTNFSLLRFDD